MARERRSQRQLREAVRVLQYVRLDEMTQKQRAFHEAHLTVTVAIAQQVAHLSRRQHAQDAVIEQLLARVDKLETA